MSTTNFDPDVFLSTTLDKPLDTKVIPCPVGDYTAMIDDLKPRFAQKQDTGETFLIFDLYWLIDDPQAKQATGRDKIRIRQSIFIDRTESGAIDSARGKNTQLGKVREALGQNRDGQPWAPSMLKGGVARVKVGHRVDKATGDTYDEIKAVTKL